MKKSELLEKGFTDEQATLVLEMHKAQLDKLKPDLEMVEKLKAEKLAAEARAQEKEEERLKLAGDFEGLKKHYAQQAAEMKAKADQEVKEVREALAARDHALVMTQKTAVRDRILASVDPRFVSHVVKTLDDAITVEHDENGAARYTLKLGGESFASEKDFLTAAAQCEEWRHVLKAGESTGSGASSTGNNSNAGADPDSAFDARLRADGLVC